MRVIDLFSGIGGFSLALDRVGMRTTRFCEIDPFCRRILARHWPDVPCHDDVTTMQFERGEADVIVGGFPCQDVSVAGKRAGLAGERSGLYRELVRALRVVRPRHAIMENVAALLANGLGTVLGDLAESGFDAEWDCVPASAVGAPHQRDRVWIVAHASDADQERRGEAGKFRFRPDGVPAGGIEANVSADVAHARSWVGAPRLAQPIRRGGGGKEESSGLRLDAEPARLGCGQGRTRRVPDSFARVRVEARRNAAHPYGARLAFGQSFGGDARKGRQAVERDADQDGRQSIWPNEPALLGVDDGLPHRVDRVKALGNTIIPRIVEMIGAALMDSDAA